MMKKCLIFLLALMLFAAPALAEPLALEGTVVATRSTAVLATAAGVIRDVYVQAGDHVEAGQAVAALMDSATYAEQSGTVTIFGEAGESTETIASRYGAVMYLTPDCRYTVSASTRNAYDAPENKIIHPSETVYVRCTTNSEHTGVGTVTLLSGSSYTVEITQGEFEDGESVYLFRSEDFSSASRIGKGTVSYADPIAYTGSGTVTALHVVSGAHVEEGTPLFSTLEAAAYSTRQLSSLSGTVASVAATPGAAVEAGALLAVIYPDDALRLQVLADEVDLRSIIPGQQVMLTFANGATATGQVESISGLQYVDASADEETDLTAYFPVYITFACTSPISCGMTAQVTFAE